MVEEISNRIISRVFHLKKVKTVFRKQKLNVLDWPRNSPGLNSIKDLRLVTKPRLQNLYWMHHHD